VPVFITSCHVSEKSKNGPVTAHATTVTTARAKTQARPTWRDVRSATSEKSLVRSGRLRSVLALHSAGLVAGLFVIAFFIVPSVDPDGHAANSDLGVSFR
jgi:hypothetical protein